MRGRAALETLFEAKFLEGDDARFIVAGKHLAAVAQLLEQCPQLFAEEGPGRELQEELTHEELKGFPPIFTPQEAADLKVAHLRSYRQPVSPPGEETSARAQDEIPTRRIFRLYSLELTPALFDKLRAHGGIRVLSGDEVASTKGGKKKGVTEDGNTIATNVVEVRE